MGWDAIQWDGIRWDATQSGEPGVRGEITGWMDDIVSRRSEQENNNIKQLDQGVRR